MKMVLRNRRDVLMAGLGLAVPGAWPAIAPAASRVTATALSDRLLLVSGAGGNVVALKAPEGLLLVDSGAPGATSRLREELKRFARGARVRVVINTHWDRNQSGGNEYFGKSGARIIAHARAAQRMATDQYIPWEDRYLEALPDAAIPREVFYQGSREITFGGERIRYGYLQQPHTDGDLYVHLRDSNVLLVGDAVAPASDPVICWYYGGWVGGRLDAQALLLTLCNEHTRIVAGTGGVVSRRELQTERDAIEKVFERVSEAMLKGFSTEDMQKAGLLQGLPRTWSDPDKALYDAHKSMWAHYNKLSQSIV